MWWVVLVALGKLATALMYRCENDEVLVVQSFGNDTIRMHCQRLDVCGYQNLRCDYDNFQPQCGGLMNFVAHVIQSAPTSPVEHTCCNLFNPRQPHIIPTHIGNDCFIYELPDGSSNLKHTTLYDSPPSAVLKNTTDIPEHMDSGRGYRLRLYLLKNKSPATLLVKGIERWLDGYRVTVCRPRCTSHEAVEKEETPIEWQTITWTSWASSSWSTWARNVWGGAPNGQNRRRVNEIQSIATNSSSSSSSPSNPIVPDIHVHVNASGNNNNVINGNYGRENTVPGHINITIHTGENKQTIGDGTNIRSSVHYVNAGSRKGDGEDGEDDGKRKRKHGRKEKDSDDDIVSGNRRHSKVSEKHNHHGGRHSADEDEEDDDETENKKGEKENEKIQVIERTKTVVQVVTTISRTLTILKRLTEYELPFDFSFAK